MPSSDYSSAIGGGLKLKGAGIDKSKKKKKKSSKSTTDNNDSKPSSTTEEATTSNEAYTALQTALADADDKPDQTSSTAEVKEYGKTEAQRRHEERRKKRLEERLQREGVKTHKERVQELNKYLSTLSEHNDMPRIGPG
ncbi:putative protein FAM32A [Septoria linicola]|nr:putative protein FAM32A [Septoria linicola]